MVSVVSIVVLACLFAVSLAENSCQNLSNCPYSYNNTMADYVEGQAVGLSPELETWMTLQLETYLDAVYDAYPPSRVDDATVFTGVGGRAYLCLRLYDRTGDGKYLALASQYMATSLAHVNSIDSTNVGFLWGRTGVWSVAAIESSLSGDEETAMAYVAKVQAIFDTAEVSKWDDFDAGKAGLIYAATFLKNHFKRDVITRTSVVAVANACVASGVTHSDEPEQYLQWISPNDGGKWLGQSHGSAGVLSQLLDVPELLVEGSDSRRLIEGTVDYIVSKQFASGNFPSEYYNEDEDELVQWDHGAPGVQAMLAKAASILGHGKKPNSAYEDSARKAADCTWERGLLYKGLQLCHGIVGNTYMQLYLFKAFGGDEKYLYRALAFQQFLMDTPELSDINLMRKPTPYPYGFYSGSLEGAIMLWADLLAASKHANWHAVAMPGYEPNI